MNRSPKKNHIKAAILAITAVAASGQTPAAVAPAFEVASIKPSTPFLQAVADGSLIGMRISPGHVSIGHFDLANLIYAAYKIKKYQLVGPDWLLTPPDPDQAAGLFDIEATPPAGATADQVPLMLQALLADRFKLTIRRGSRESDIYALVVGASGPKFQKKEPLGEAGSPGAESRVLTATQGPKGQATVGIGATKMTIVPGAGTRVETSTIAGIVDYLSSRMPVPVIDKTGLQGYFDIKMEISPTDRSSLLAGDAAALMAPLFDAVGKLGLKLEAQKNQVETIIVDHIERIPSAN